jgi:hypothetical protein
MLYLAYIIATGQCSICFYLSDRKFTSLRRVNLRASRLRERPRAPASPALTPRAPPALTTRRLPSLFLAGQS